jgi:hypothetical protein
MLGSLPPRDTYCPLTAYLKYTVQLQPDLLIDRTLHTWVLPVKRVGRQYTISTRPAAADPAHT